MMNQYNLPVRRNVNVPNLVRSVENNIENFGSNMGGYRKPPMPVPQIQPQQLPRNQYITQQPMPPTYRQLVPNQYNIQVPHKKIKSGGFMKTVKKCLSGLKYYLVLICVFSLLSHKSVRRFVQTNIPFVNTYESEIPSILFRGGIFVVLLNDIK